MTDRFILRNDRIRANAIEAIRSAPDNHVVSVAPKTRSLAQNDHFHALCRDLAASDVEWAGKRRNETEWKLLLISGHAVATDQPGEVIPGLEGEFVAIRESSARMGVARAGSLIDYTLAYCIANQVDLKETRRGGFYDERDAA